MSQDDHTDKDITEDDPGADFEDELKPIDEKELLGLKRKYKEVEEIVPEEEMFQEESLSEESRIEEGEAEGRKKSKREIARNLLRDDLDIDALGREGLEHPPSDTRHP